MTYVSLSCLSIHETFSSFTSKKDAFVRGNMGMELFYAPLQTVICKMSNLPQ